MGKAPKKTERSHEATSHPITKKEEWDWQEIRISALKIGISHEEFWRMTPVELKQSIESYWWRVDQERQYLAHLAAAIVNPHTKKAHQRNRFI
jgi:hypothetical protein